MSRISLSNEEDDFPSASTEETRDGERTRLLPKSGSQTRMQGIQNEIRAGAPGMSPIIHEDEDNIVIRRPVTYLPINGSDSIDNGDSGSQEDVRLFQSRYRYYGRLDPHSRSAFLMPAHILLPQYYTWVPMEVKREPGKQSSLVTIFTIWNTMLGTSILSMPWALEKAGFTCGISIIVIMAGLMLYTAYRVMKSQQNIGVEGSIDMDFSDICRHYLGRWGEYSSMAFSLLSLLGATVVYWVLMSNFLYNSVTFVYEKANNEFNISKPETLNNHTIPNDVFCYIPPNVPGAKNVSLLLRAHYSNQHFPPIGASVEDTQRSDEIFKRVWRLDLTVPFFLIVFLGPLINFKSPTFFTKFNALGTISVLYIVTFVAVKAGEWGFHLDFAGTALNPSIPQFQWTFPALSGILSLAYFIHNCILQIMKNQKNPENNGRDLSIAYLLVMMTYVFIGVVFYSSFPLPKTCIADNLLNNFVNYDIMTFVARIFLFFQMITVFPLLMYIFRVQVLAAIFGSVYPSLKHVLCFNGLVLAVCVIFAIFLPHIGTIIRYCGAICGVVYVFTLPCIVYMLQLRDQSQLNVWIIIFHVVIIAIGLANCIAQFFI